MTVLKMWETHSRTTKRRNDGYFLGWNRWLISWIYLQSSTSQATPSVELLVCCTHATTQRDWKVSFYSHQLVQKMRLPRDGHTTLTLFVQAVTPISFPQRRRLTNSSALLKTESTLWPAYTRFQTVWEREWLVLWWARFWAEKFTLRGTSMAPLVSGLWPRRG